MLGMSEEEAYKITVTLSRKAFATLEWLKEMSGFGSRGRTIEEAILTIWDLAEFNEGFTQTYLKVTKEGGTPDFSLMNSYYIVNMTKLARFGSPSEYRKRFEK